ncbi:phosphate ABC transporter permease PstA [Allostreptomyces psammosilenae]|uniref:Phosphate transport system permease protein PstA n=1 Tax=Allostreptomyces psammosilenae TaxID=1892865 RepID=A0A853A067_9ACTN|nr:phosphate ABC transporter permease PstA [Allostreptomyces psammosilenae]NYI07507.1 phosphate transport system permease protein [Allostreptomyces psammosilenae]
MSTITTTQGPGSRLDLTAGRLPNWAPRAILVGGLAAGYLLNLVILGADPGTFGGHAGAVVIGAVLYAAVLIGVSARVEGARKARDRFATTLVTGAFALALLPLVGVLSYTVIEGIGGLTPYFLTHSMNGVGARDDSGGVYHALVGTLQQVGIATLIAVPIGILTAIYLVEYGRGTLARAVTFFVDVMTGIPSIVAGLFVLSFWILMLEMGPSGFAGSLALTILMIPTVVRSAEEMLRLVPNELREASLALGVPKWRTILRVVLPTAMGGLVTGVMLAVARVTGETAPVMLLVFGTPSINMNPFDGAQSSLPLFVYSQYGEPNDFAQERAWAAALLLIIIVMALNLAARLIARWRAPKGGH